MKIVIIGGGPGGYAAAIKAAQLGAEVTLAEHAQVGGTCLNVGCIPTKALLHVGEFYRRVSKNTVAGVNITGAELDWPAAQSYKEAVVQRLTGGVSALLRHNGVTIINEKATLVSGGKVKIADKTFETDAVILATGSVNTALKFPGCDLPGVIDSTGALSLEKTPKSIVIVGGGVIGVEFAALYGALGAKVTIIELTPEILPSLDYELAALLREALTQNGVDVFTGAALTEIKKTAGRLSVSFNADGETKSVTVEKALVAVGRKPDTSAIDDAGVKIERGAVCVDEYFRTTVPGVYAVGDCIGHAMLAHAAMAQGIAAAEHAMGVKSRYNPKVIPSCVYSSPELAAVGMNEKQVKDSGIEYAIGRFDLSGNGRAVIDGTPGCIKIIADKKLGEILGVHILGPYATEMIAEAAICMSMEGTVEDIVNTIHAHPTVSEAVCEAAMSVFGKPIHGI